MRSQWLLPTLLLVASPLVAAEPIRFKFQAGESLTYTAKQVTTVVETTIEEGTNRPVTAMIVTKLTLTRKWAVKSVAADGTATLDLSILAMRQQITRPGPPDKNGKPTIDTEVLDSATPEGREQMTEFLNKPIATVKMDGQGRALETSGTPAARLRTELPFRFTLPDQSPAVGSTWDRAFPVAVSTGEKYEAMQTFTLKAEAANMATIAVVTSLKSPPKDPAEWSSLVPTLWQGEAYFDKSSGRYAGSKLTSKKEVANHQGEGTKFSYESSYDEAPCSK